MESEVGVLQVSPDCPPGLSTSTNQPGGSATSALLGTLVSRTRGTLGPTQRIRGNGVELCLSLWGKVEGVNSLSGSPIGTPTFAPRALSHWTELVWERGAP